MVAHALGLPITVTITTLHEESVLFALSPCDIAHYGDGDAVHDHKDPKYSEFPLGQAEYHVPHLMHLFHRVTKVSFAQGSGG